MLEENDEEADEWLLKYWVAALFEYLLGDERHPEQSPYRKLSFLDKKAIKKVLRSEYNRRSKIVFIDKCNDGFYEDVMLDFENEFEKLDSGNLSPDIKTEN